MCKSINDLVHSLVKSITESYSTIEFKSRLSPLSLSAASLLSDSRLSPAELLSAEERYQGDEERIRADLTQLKSELIEIMCDEELSWTRRYNSYNLFSRCLVRIDLELKPAEIEVLVRELTNERPKWQSAAFYYTQVNDILYIQWERSSVTQSFFLDFK